MHRRFSSKVISPFIPCSHPHASAQQACPVVPLSSSFPPQPLLTSAQVPSRALASKPPTPIMCISFRNCPLLPLSAQRLPQSYRSRPCAPPSSFLQPKTTINLTFSRPLSPSVLRSLLSSLSSRLPPSAVPCQPALYFPRQRAWGSASRFMKTSDHALAIHMCEAPLTSRPKMRSG
jgi:hypothetical protein